MNRILVYLCILNAWVFVSMGPLIVNDFEINIDRERKIVSDMRRMIVEYEHSNRKEDRKELFFEYMEMNGVSDNQMPHDVKMFLKRL